MPGTELLFRDDAYVRESAATVMVAEGGRVQLDRTIFYPQGGGQPGDRGSFITEDGRVFRVTDTRKGVGADGVIHLVEGDAAGLVAGTMLTAMIDWDYRYRLMRLHTCLHLLCAVVPGAVTGGQISDGKARLDFDVDAASLDKDEITATLNRLIEAGHAVTPRWISDEEMADRPELVRTMSVKPPTGFGRVRLLDIAGVDLQPCGGTHVKNTAEIGKVLVTKIENKGRQNRRVNISFP
ncbi:MAG TPA: alanyl-tRNA editing protein [Rhizomicrobium sp.]|nr:alanyl-tRNA editing protein [Rhizomicrobium sp.]